MASKELNKLGKEYWEFVLKTCPTLATFLGDSRYDHRLEEFGPQTRKKQVAANQAFLKRLKKIKLEKLTQREKVTYRILELKLKEYMESQKFKDWEWNLDQLFGPHIQLMDLLDIHPLKTKKNYDDLLKRYKATPKYIDQYLGDLKDGLKSGRVAPYVAYDRVVDQLQKFIQINPLDSRFAEPLKKFPKSFSKKEQQKYLASFEKTCSSV
ncbi:MAG: DUF885 family protein [Deltaproteobacteria bacterium]|nr:DUF885 family protein [Deltaproteobacteria bacterium]